MGGLPLEQFTWIVVAIAALGLGCIFFIARSKPRKVEEKKEEPVVKPVKNKPKTATIIVKDQPIPEPELEPENTFTEPKDRLEAYREALLLHMLDIITQERVDKK